MGKKKTEVVETGVFASPATRKDSPYELLQDPEGGLSVRCIESGATYDTSILAKPTHAQIEDQRLAFLREIAAWLSTNGPSDPLREEAAATSISLSLQAEYTQADLGDDRQWILSNDLSVRVPLLRDGLDEACRLELIQFAASIGAVGNGISETDAQFIEFLGAGLGLDPNVVTDTVVQAIQSSQAA